MGERPSSRSASGARPARAPYVAAAGELAGLGSVLAGRRQAVENAASKVVIVHDNMMKMLERVIQKKAGIDLGFGAIDNDIIIQCP